MSNDSDRSQGASPQDVIAELRRILSDSPSGELRQRIIPLLQKLDDYVDRWVQTSRAQAQELHAKLERSRLLACTDNVTELANRHVFDERIRNAWDTASRTGAPVGLLLIDVDGFKDFNDAHGHLVGDSCLRKVAAAIKSTIDRPSDVACRYGGDEFAVILPETDEAGARRLATSIRNALAASDFQERRTKLTKFITVSIGAASVSAVGQESSDTLIAAADSALYEAKRRGRNRVVVSSGVTHKSWSAPNATRVEVEKVRFKMVGDQLTIGDDVVKLSADGKSFTGRILSSDDQKVIQSIGRGIAVVHNPSRLDNMPAAGDMVCVMYRRGRAQVVQLIQVRELERSQDR